MRVAKYWRSSGEIRHGSCVREEADDARPRRVRCGTRWRRYRRPVRRWPTRALRRSRGRLGRPDRPGGAAQRRSRSRCCDGDRHRRRPLPRGRRSRPPGSARASARRRTRGRRRSPGACRPRRLSRRARQAASSRAGRPRLPATGTRRVASPFGGAAEESEHSRRLSGRDRRPARLVERTRPRHPRGVGDRRLPALPPRAREPRAVDLLPPLCPPPQVPCAGSAAATASRIHSAISRHHRNPVRRATG